MSQVRASKQSEGGCKGRMSELGVGGAGGAGGLPPSRGPDPEGSRIGEGRISLEGVAAAIWT